MRRQIPAVDQHIPRGHDVQGLAVRVGQADDADRAPVQGGVEGRAAQGEEEVAVEEGQEGLQRGGEEVVEEGGGVPDFGAAEVEVLEEGVEGCEGVEEVGEHCFLFWVCVDGFGGVVDGARRREWSEGWKGGRVEGLRILDLDSISSIRDSRFRIRARAQLMITASMSGRSGTR